MDEATFERELERRFQYAPPPAPAEVADPAAGRTADAAYFQAFPDFDRAYSPAARAQAKQLAARLREEAHTLNHEQFVLRVAEIAALANNAHTSIGEDAFRKDTPRLPIRAFLFADGLFVLQASAEHTDLLGGRVDTIEGRPVERVLSGLRRYVGGGTQARQRLLLLPLLESPAMLHSAGLANDRSSLTIAGRLADGRPFQRRVQAQERGRAAPVMSTIRLLFPGPTGAPLRSLLRRDGPLPVYLRVPQRLFALDDLSSGGVYIRLTHNEDGDDEPLKPFLAQAVARVREKQAQYVVLDLRMNAGGDFTKTYSFGAELVAAAGEAPIYILTSPWTFSAAMTTAAAVKQAGGNRVRIVGEPVGDRLDFWSEGSSFRLPNTFLVVYYAAGRHNYAGPCRDSNTCFWLDKRYPVRLRSLQPDIPVTLTFAAYRQGRDPAMEAVLGAECRRRGSRRASLRLAAAASIA